MYYHFYTSYICESYLKTLIKKNDADLENIQTKFHNNEEVSNLVYSCLMYPKSIRYNI